MDAARSFESLAAFVAAVGEPLGTGEWLTVGQDRIEEFANATDDHQWIHVDAQRAAAGPFGTTIAHGYLTLSLIPVLRRSAFEIDGVSRLVNYGLDRVRFPAPLRSGAKVRCHAQLVAAHEVADGGWQVTVRCTLEADDTDRPVCVADTLTRLYP